MAHQEEFTCKQCGSNKKLGSYQGYCKKCYSEIWDSGFQSTSEHAYQIGHGELNRKIAGQLDDSFGQTINQIKSDFETERWECTKCGCARPDDALLEPCPNCGSSGFLKHFVKGRYYH